MSGHHAFLAPSSASIWGPGGCPAYPSMAPRFPEPETLAAQEGDAAHYYVTETIRGRPTPTVAPNKLQITDEMVECGQAMIADVLTLRAENPNLVWLVEQEIRMPQVHPVHNWGRSDFGAVDYEKRIVYDWDFKFGHRYVDVFENWQLVDYGQGIVNFFGVELTPEWSFDFRIYQPRSFHPDGPVKRWAPDYAAFTDAISRLRDAATQATDPDAPMHTGDHCGDCPARHACPALRKAGGLAVDMSYRGVPHILEPADAGLALRIVRTARERLEDLETGLEAQIMSIIREGDMSTGWEAFQGYGREKWTQPAADVIAMGAAFGKTLAKPIEPITPAQARKLGIDEAVISAYSEKPKGEIKLRPLDGKSIRKAFSAG